MNRTVAQITALAVASVALLTGCASAVPVPVVGAPAAPLVQVDLESADPTLVSALVNAGHKGTPIDGCECFYLPQYATVAVSGGIWTITPDTGPRFCGHGTTASCTGWEFIPE